jgi:hypothetical protein
MTREERLSNQLAKGLVKALCNLSKYLGDPQDVLDDAKVLLVRPRQGQNEAKEMIYYLECRLNGDDPYGGRA